MAEASSPPRTVRWPVKAWFCFHVVWITLYCLPQPAPAVREGRAQGSLSEQFLAWSERTTKSGVMKHYMLSTGMWQYWDMFAPDPLSLDYYVQAQIQFESGEVVTEDFPRVYTLPIPAKYPAERHRKFIERAHLEENLFLWPPLAQWMAQRAWDTHRKTPYAVRLVLRRRQIPKPQPNFVWDAPFEEVPFYDHMVDLETLRRPR